MSLDEHIPYAAIEKKWQNRWEEKGLFKTPENPSADKKFYCLDMFPYPSGAGLHVGHPEGYTATDILCRLKRMKGHDVLHPMGWDAFGLPAENYAIQTGIHPREVTEKNVANFKRQIKSLGFSYDWDREINTTSPEYYRWTQWIFLQLFKKGLAYESTMPINWCPSCSTGLANEEVFDGTCERCSTPIERRAIRQWMLKITAYADRLLTDLDGVDWPKSTLAMQKNWIGRSEGAEVDFKIGDHAVRIFTTRPDTLFGATYMVLSPEHPLVEKIVEPEFKNKVYAYIEASSKKSDIERSDASKEKTGVPTGALAINPVNGAKIPVWIADYVLAGYGTGAIMAVPAHDQRDFEFAQKYELSIRKVIEPPEGLEDAEEYFDTKAYTGEGKSINSDILNGLETGEAKKKILAHLEEAKIGKAAINYRLRDWVFSRQRYWGEPIPIVTCKKCGHVPVPESELPLLLPDVRHYKPTGTGESPLAAVHSWVNTICPKCGGDAKRETNTMPQWAGSCWYYLRFIDPKNEVEMIDAAAEKKWMPVDCYIGGAEHAVLHLLYARFWHKVLYDMGYVTTKEPFQKLRHQGMIISFSYRDTKGVYHPYDAIKTSESGATLKETGEELVRQVEKMSKTKKNVVNPDDVLKDYGADVFRLYEMFMGPFADSKPWNTHDILGRVRFIRRVWKSLRNPNKFSEGTGLESLRHKTIKKIGEDIEALHFNTAISALDIYLNAIVSEKSPTKTDVETFLQLLNPFAPHVTEEIWERLGHEPFLSAKKWPAFDPKKLIDAEFEMPIQVNGKLRGRLKVPTTASKEEIEKLALAEPHIKVATEGKKVARIIVVPKRLVNVVLV